MPLEPSAPFGPVDKGAEAAVIDVRMLLAALQRRRWIALATFALCVALGVIYTARAPRIYSATTTLVIERSAPEVLSGVRDVYDLGTGNYWAVKDYYETQYNLIRSRPVAVRVLQTLGVSTLAMIDEINSFGASRAADDIPPELAESISYRMRVLGLGGIKSRAALVRILEHLDAADIMAKRISVVPVKDSQLVRVTILDPDPELAARIANAVASAYSDVNLSQKVELTRNAVDWLRGQVTDLKATLEASEMMLHEFKKANSIVSASMEDKQTIVVQTLTQLNQELSAATAKRIGLESRRDQLKRVLTADVPADAVEEVLVSPIIQNLKESYAKLHQEESELLVRYTPEHPRVVAIQAQMKVVDQALRDEINKIMRTIEDQYRTASETEKRLRAAMDGVTTEALDVGRKEIEYSRLLRERDNNKALYSLVLNRQKEADLTQMLHVNNVRQLEAALPSQRPVSPRVRMNIAASAALGMLLAFLAALLADFLDNTLKTQEQTERILGLPFLGIVPSIKAERGDASGDDTFRDRYILTHPRSSVAECCKTLRTNLMFMATEAPAQCLLVTSSGPREGKSTTVMNLAVTMAQLGARTLVVDTDLRRPRIHKSWGLSNDMGVSSLIVNEGTLEAAVQRTDVDRLDVLSCGPIPPNPAELLHTDAFKALVAQLRKRYDRILFDSPPIVAVTDAQVLASVVDGVVLVTRAGKTTWQAARLAKRRLTDVGAKIFGVVLNNVDLSDRRATHYYEYAYYYPSEEKAQAGA